MSSRVIKANTYFPVSSDPFEMPLPIKLELHHANTLLCVYSVKSDLTVDYSYNANTEIPLLTPPDKLLTIKDVYYIIRSRVFRENPFTLTADLARVGLTEYNPYEIILKTYGMLPLDAYWLKRADDSTDFTEARRRYQELMFGSPPEAPKNGIDDFLG